MKIGEQITSPQNKRIKELKKLSQKKHRDVSGCFAVENMAIIHDALAAGYDFEELYVTDDFIKNYAEKFRYLCGHSRASSYHIISPQANRTFSELETPAGIAAVYKREKRPLVSGKPVIYLNGVGDPGNAGAIMRTMLAFGFTNLVVDEQCADIYNPKTIQAAKDAIFKIHALNDRNLAWFRQERDGRPVYAAVMQGKARLGDFIPVKDYCLVLGSESHGISPEILEMAEATIGVEMTGAMESLNVAAAAAIILYKWRNA